MGRRGYPPEFRRKVLDLVEAGRPIAEVAQALGISAQSISTWHRQDRIDPGPVARPEQPREGGAGGHAPGRRAAQGASAPFRPFAAIQVMAEAAGAGLLPGAGGFGVRLLRLAQPATFGPGDPACLADRCHPWGVVRRGELLREPARAVSDTRSYWDDVRQDEGGRKQA